MHPIPPTPIAVLTGGYSAEAPVSRKSAAMVMNNIDRNRWAPTLVHIDPDGWWAEVEGHGRLPIDRLDFSIQIPGQASKHQFAKVLIMVHGTPGENGRLQAYFEMIGMPHTNGSPRSMALTFHKGWTTTLLRSEGIPVAQGMLLRPGTPLPEPSTFGGFPCFVKPNEAGSSFGVSLVEGPEEFQKAVDFAFNACAEEASVLVESMLPGREFSVGVIPSESDWNQPQALPVTEIVAHAAFFDYAAKYQGASDEITPADIPSNIAAAMQATALSVYNITECRGMARVDMKWEANGNMPPAVIEVNTIPGFTEHSLVPQQAEHIGLSRKELINRILGAA
ncbi:MAG: D-alanine--D-alanine ligase family protein [Flavobacteriales bacterium]